MTWQNVLDDDCRNLNDQYLVSSNTLDSKYKNSRKLSKKKREEVDRQKTEVELSVIDTEEKGHGHFDMKETTNTKNAKRKGKKKKGNKGNKDIQDDNDDLEINV